MMKFEDISRLSHMTKQRELEDTVKQIGIDEALTALIVYIELKDNIQAVDKLHKELSATTKDTYTLVEIDKRRQLNNKINELIVRQSVLRTELGV